MAELDPLLGNPTELPIDLGFVVAVAPLEKQARAPTDKAFVVVGPFNDFLVTGGLEFLFGDFHGDYD
jgi:hypothetical protein